LYATHASGAVRLALGITGDRMLSLERSFLEREVAMQTTAGGPGTQPEVWDAVLRLPPRQRAAIALRYYEDLSVDQAAAVLGCPAGTVKSLASRGIAQLRKDLVAEPARDLVA
jgi:DNA-directed RNA polymerase specialized sigma24 family protein